ncbi:MAG: cupin domain-containing protein [Methanomassiliicoccales archaeon]|jgi:quercetin dioxygenase-like cupin family protein
MVRRNGSEPGELLGKHLKMNDLVSYQEGSVVSRTLIDKPAGTVTIFAFDQGQGLSEHAAPYDAMVQILEGKVDLTLSGIVHSMKAGDVIIMPANEPHALEAIKQFKMLLTMVRQPEKVKS